MRASFTSRKILLQFIDIATTALLGLVIFFTFPSLLQKLNLAAILPHLFLFIVFTQIARLLAGGYNTSWRYAYIYEYLRLIGSDLISGSLFVIVQLFIFSGFIPADYSSTLVECNIITTLIGRFIYQLIYINNNHNANSKDMNAPKIPIAIIGAGNNAALLANTLSYKENSKYEPICFIDSDPVKVGNSILGHKVYPEDEKTLDLLTKLKIQEIVVAIDNATSEKTDKLFDYYIKNGFKVRIYDYPLEKNVFASNERQIRNIRIEDLLFRDTIELNNDKVYNYYSGKVILVTGGGGSIGSEICRQIAKTAPKKIVILDIYENNAYDIQQELIRTYGLDFNVVIELASIREAEKIRSIFSRHQPDIVFHTAAHKHVPIMEYCSDEAVKNNVFGTFNVANAAEEFGVKKFIAISTDKAVNPTNVMGATKNICEMIIDSKKDSKTDFMAVRFGNVLGSNGSVIPLFKKQIENGGPLTITDKRIIRYFMTISEATQLVMQAGMNASKSDIYVLDMGKPISILTLAENMIKLSGFIPYVDIDIVEIGLRPGEKLYEELLINSDQLEKTENNKIFVERRSGITRDQLDRILAILEDSLAADDSGELRKAIKKVVPTFKEADEINRKAIDENHFASKSEAVAAATTISAKYSRRF
jgi:Predicted nucleoside-diphosphate sugar epimerases